MRILLIITFIFLGVYCSAQVKPKKHFHSWALNRDIDINAKDSAYKYWKLMIQYQDTDKKRSDAYRRKSIYYKEKQ